MRLNTGSEEERARDLFYALWIPDLFMKRVETDSDWTLMCPKECPGLDDAWGDKFEELYTKYERDGRGRQKVKARDIWKLIITAQIETGVPYMLYKVRLIGSALVLVILWDDERKRPSFNATPIR